MTLVHVPADINTVASSAALRNQWKRIGKWGSSLPAMTTRCRRWTLNCAPHACSWTPSRQCKFKQPQILCPKIIYIKPGCLSLYRWYTCPAYSISYLETWNLTFFIPTDWLVYRRNLVRQRTNQQPICWLVKTKYYSWKQSSWSPFVLLR